MKIKTTFLLPGIFSALFLCGSFVVAEKAARQAQDRSFLEFLSHFKKVDLPFAIRAEDMKGYAPYLGKLKSAPTQVAATKSSELPASFLKFIPGAQHFKMSRMGPPVVRPVARFYPNQKIIAVIYASEEAFGDGLFVDYYLAMYDLRGRALNFNKKKDEDARRLLVASSSMEETVTCELSPNGKIQLNYLENAWEKDVQEQGVEDNKIKHFKPVKTESYAMGEKGEVSEVRAVVAARP